jgi:hypothetical protein
MEGKAMSQNTEKAEKVTEQQTDKDISALIVTLGQDRLKAQQSASASLDNRFGQVVSFQFAAAAVSATYLATHDAAGIVDGAARLAFLVGGAIAFRGMRSDHQHLPGIEPSWWHPALSAQNFDLAKARSWLAGLTEEMIEFNAAETEHRARALNTSLWVGAFGAALLAVTNVTRLFL